MARLRSPVLLVLALPAPLVRHCPAHEHGRKGDRADNRDVKSQMSLLAAGTFALAGWQFWSRAEKERRETGAKILGVEVVPQVELDRGRVGLALKRRFF